MNVLQVVNDLLTPFLNDKCISNTSTMTIHVIARFTIQLMVHNSKEAITGTTNI